MSPAEIARFLDAPRVLQVSTIGRDGWPHVVPMWYVVEDGKVVFRSYSKSQKIVNLRRDPRIAVLVESGATYPDLQGLLIKGEARLISDPAYVLSVYGRLAARYSLFGVEPVAMDAAAVEAAFGAFAAKNTAVVVEPVSVASWDHRKLGAE